jgi:hypothetical protein
VSRLLPKAVASIRLEWIIPACAWSLEGRRFPHPNYFCGQKKRVAVLLEGNSEIASD